METTTHRAIELVAKGSEQTVAWQCTKCGSLWPLTSWGDAKERAETCCFPACADCGTALEHHHTRCEACRVKHDLAQEQALYEKASKIALEDYKGEIVYIEGAYNGGYVSKADVLDALSHMKDPPTWGWSTVPQQAGFNLRENIESYLLDEHHEDADEHADWVLVAAAQILVDHALKGVTTYYQDNEVAIVFPKREAAVAE